MVEKFDSDGHDEIVWIVRPTRSLTWPEAKRWLCVLSSIPLASGLLFLWFGVPLVLPFAGLEILFLWAAFWYVHWTGQWREVIRLTPRHLVIEKGRHCPEQRYQYERAWVGIRFDERRGWLPSRLKVGSHGRAADIGSFLAEGERRALALALINALEKTR
jgi:uncharacterized membrane protein